MTGVRAWVRQFPAISLFLLAVAFGTAPIVPVALGWLPAGFDQLGALSASLAGVVLAGLLDGRAGVRALLRRGLIWRVGFGWWAFVLLFPAVPTLLAFYLGGRISGTAVGLSHVGSPLQLVGTILFLVVFAGVGEEFGWRGFGLPRLQARYGAFPASLAIGVLHWLWHTPLFFIKGVSQYDLARQLGFWPAFLGFGVLVVGTAILLTWVFNNTGGSVLMVAVFHGALNGWNGYIDILRAGPAAAFVYSGLLLLASIVVTVVAGPEHLSRTRRRIQDGPAAA